MLDGGLAVAHIGVFGQFAHRQSGMFGKHLSDGLKSAMEGVDDGVDLDAIARREHHRLGDQRRLQDLADHLGLIGLVGGELLEHRDRCASVRHPEQQDAHSPFT